MTQKALVAMRHISKHFGGIHALEDVSIDLYPGEVMGIVGHNGAGKSTLIKILSGAQRADRGDIYIRGQAVQIHSPRDAKQHGIETIYQNLALADNLTAPANIFLGREITTAAGVLDDDAMETETRNILQRLDLRIKSLRDTVKSMSGGQRQAIAIGRAIYFNAKILIMDEPTAALGPQESAKVVQLIRQLKKEGIGIFLISHDIHDVFDLCDRISILHNGRLVATCPVDSISKEEALSMIILGEVPRSMALASTEHDWP